MKTPDEIKRGLECALCDKPADLCGEKCPGWSAYSLAEMRQDEHVSDALAYIQQLETKSHQLIKKTEQLEAHVPRWISVGERLPPMGEVLISHCGHVCIAWHHGKGTFETGSRMMLVVGRHDITHWMPMPEPPKGGVN